jgi:glucose/arabinose dehydrogenase
VAGCLDATRPATVSVFVNTLLLAAAVLLSPSSSLVLNPLVTGLDHPVQIVAAHDQSSQLYIAEQSGRILVLPSAHEEPKLFLDMAAVVGCCDNGGLLSVVFHPAFAGNGLFFVLYVDKNGDTVVARYSRSGASPETADPNSAEILFVVPQPKDNIPNHHGGTLQFGPDGYLYVSIGDGGAFVHVTNRAQEVDHLLGKLLRIDVSAATGYAIPQGNPFSTVQGARKEIWSIGLRNPWRFSFDRLTGELMIADVGQDDWEEVNIVSLAEARGANFGWPRTEGLHCYPQGEICSVAGLTLPAIEYPSELGCSVTGGYRYRGNRWSSLYGKYVYGDFCSGRIWAASETGGHWQPDEITDSDLAIVSFGEDDAGELYVVDYNGSVFELTMPANRRRAVRH